MLIALLLPFRLFEAMISCVGGFQSRSALSDFKATHQEILGSNNLQGKRRTISTSLVSKTRERSAQLLHDIPLNRTCAAVSNAAPLPTSYLGDAGIKISGYGRRLTSHARTW